jgi:hypothetical protein
VVVGEEKCAETDKCGKVVEFFYLVVGQVDSIILVLSY